MSPVSIRDWGEIDRAVASFASPLARYLARFLQGARAGDRPIEMPTHFGSAINFRTANAFCAAHAPLARADEVTE